MNMEAKAYALKMKRERHAKRLLSHGLIPVTLHVHPDDVARLGSEANRLNLSRGKTNTVFDEDNPDALTCCIDPAKHDAIRAAVAQDLTA